MITPAVDVVVVSWNTRDDLLTCLRSTLASRDVDVRIVVVDNASSDGSADAVESEFDQVTVVRNRHNAGFARAVNAGIRVGHSPHVLLLNPDTVVTPDALRALVARLDELPEHAAVAPRLVDERGAVQQSAYPLPSLAHSLLLGTGAHRLVPRALRARMLLPGAWKSDVDRDVPWAIGAVLLVRRSVVERVGGLDERFFVYTEDVEWCERATRAGHGVRFVPSVTVTHVGNRSGSQRYGEDRTAAWMTNTLRFIRMRHGRLWSATYVAINGAATISRYAVSWVLGRIRPTPRRDARTRMWRGYARYYAGRASRVETTPSP